MNEPKEVPKTPMDELRELGTELNSLMKTTEKLSGTGLEETVKKFRVKMGKKLEETNKQIPIVLEKISAVEKRLPKKP